MLRHDYHHSLSLAHFLAYGLTVDGVVSSTKRVTCTDCRPIRYIWGKGLQRNAFKIGLNVIDISPKSSYSPKVLHVPWIIIIIHSSAIKEHSRRFYDWWFHVGRSRIEIVSRSRLPSWSPITLLFCNKTVRIPRCVLRYRQFLWILLHLLC